ncbi:MAG: hypothetical protein ACYC19_08760 [Acidimicrobiales bacterium]
MQVTCPEGLVVQTVVVVTGTGTVVGGTYTVVVGVGAGGAVGVGAAGRTGACVVGGAVAGRLGVEGAFGAGVDARARARGTLVDDVGCPARGVVVVVVAPATPLPCTVGGNTALESAAT